MELYGIFVGPPLRAQRPAAVVEQFAQQTSLSTAGRIVLSPDSSRLAYLILTPNSKDTKSYVELRIVNRSTKQVVNVCCGEAGDVVAPSWSPDGERLAFVQMSQAGGQLMVYDVKSGKTQQAPHSEPISEDPDQWNFTEMLLWADRDHILIVTSDKLPTNNNQTKDDKGITVWNSFPQLGSNGKPILAPTSESIGGELPKISIESVDLRNAGSTVVVSGVRLEYPKLSPNGRYLAYAEYKDSSPTEQTDRFNVHLLDLSTRNDVVVPGMITLYVANIQVFNWRDDSAAVAFPTQSQLQEATTFTYRVAEGRDWSTVSELQPLMVQRDRYTQNIPALWTDHGKRLTAVATDNYSNGLLSSRFVTWDISTKQIVHSLLVDGRRVRQVVAGAKPGSDILAISITSAMDAARVLRYSPSDGTMTQLFTMGAAPQYLWGQPVMVGSGSSFLVALSALDHHVEIEEVDEQGHRSRWTDADPRVPGSIARYEPVEWRGGDGEMLQGGLMLPAAYDPSAGTRLPLIVRVYPTPHVENGPYSYALEGVDFDARAEALSLVQDGYAVFVPDCPTRPISFATDLANDVLPGIQKVIELGIADPDSVGIIGHSDGVVASLNLLTLSRQFKAAVLTDGFDNYLAEYGQISNYGLTAITLGPESLKAPWEDPQRYIEDSPVFKVDRINAPILLFHGAADNVVPLYEGEEIFTNLRAAGKTAQLVEYAGGGHGLGDRTLQQQIDCIRRTLEWFDKYLKASTKPDIPDPLPVKVN